LVEPTDNAGLAPAAAPSPASVNVTRYLLIFSAAYSGLLVVLGLLATLIGLRGNSGLSVAVLIGACMTASFFFMRQHRRPYNRREYHWMLWGSLVIDIAVQLAITMALIDVPLNIMVLGGLLLIAVLHGLAIAFFYSKRMTKNLIPLPKAT
jgi:peptidoglycan biosynthesis protein MviN/MurJ (putative lipid II flippase)